ncbi:MAG: ATP synthase F0 subunit B [Deltaproteobacteria bacterium]|nr:ATP synthase F0 subunit B [Deltaproteobacteria bacterium]
MVSVDQTIFIQIVIFLLTVLVINVFMFKPIFRTLEKRYKLIDGARDEADKLNKKTEIKIHSYNRRIIAARQQAKEEKQRMIAEGRELEQKQTNDARKKTEEVISKASKEIQKEMEIARKEIKAQIGDLALEIASKLGGRNFGKGKNA